nr:DMT family transporter [Piscirickettsia salmonis]
MLNAILLLPLTLLLHKPVHLTIIDDYVLLLSGVSSALFYLFWFKGAPAVDGTTSGLMTALMPIFTLLLSWFFLSEKISALQGFAMLLILLSIFFSNQSKGSLAKNSSR